MSATTSAKGPAREKTPLWVKVAIQTFAYAVGLAILATVDHYTHWIGIF